MTDIIETLLFTADVHSDEEEGESSISLMCIRAVGEIRRLAGAIERELVARTSLIEARNDIQTWIDSRNEWMKRAEAAEAELANLAQQEPVAWMHDRDGRVDTCHDSVKELWIKVGQKQNTQFMREIVPCRVEHYNIPLYAAPAPAPHKGATHCDDCGLTWLDDGLNPLRCPYCKDSVPAPAVPEDLLLCDVCGAECDDPWHYSKGSQRHLHACDNCHTSQTGEQS